MTPIHFFINSKKHKIAYMIRKAKKINHLQPIIVFLSGYRSNMQGTKASFVDFIAENMPFDYLRFDYSGHGESEGDFKDLTLSDWIQDSQELIEHIIGQERSVILVGSSMGAWIAIKLFEKLKNPITHFIALAPAPDFSSILMQHQRETPEFQKQISAKGFVQQKCDYEGEDFIITKKFLDDADRNSVLDKPIQFDGAVHIIQGMHDNEVPYQHALLLSDRITSKNIKIELLKSSNHRLSEHNDLECFRQAIECALNSCF